MANTFLNLDGLRHYDSKIKSVAAGNISIEGLTITLQSIDGKALGTVTIPQTKFELASSTADGLMSKEDKAKCCETITQMMKEKIKLTYSICVFIVPCAPRHYILYTKQITKP